MNDDVLSTIAGYCDIDTRRDAHNIFGLVSRPLKRNAGFDAKLQTIHQMRDVERTQQRMYPEAWRIRLNNRINARIGYQNTTGGSSYYQIFTSSYRPWLRRGYWARYEWISNDSGYIVTSHIQNIRVIDKRIPRLNAIWTDGKWTVNRRKYGVEVVRQLGYTLGNVDPLGFGWPFYIGTRD
jgi:hypothetical protein